MRMVNVALKLSLFCEGMATLQAKDDNNLTK